MRDNILALDAQDKLEVAGISHGANRAVVSSIRKDKIYWMDRSHDNAAEHAFLDVIDDFVAYLNRTCFTGIVESEFHYAVYEPGSFYKRHLDQFKDDDRRAFSMICYLNADWVAADGGQLAIYKDNTQVLVEPRAGSCVFFKSSDLEHEVLLCHKQRLSITGWFKTR